MGDKPEISSWKNVDFEEVRLDSIKGRREMELSSCNLVRAKLCAMGADKTGEKAMEWKAWASCGQSHIDCVKGDIKQNWTIKEKVVLQLKF